MVKRIVVNSNVLKDNIKKESLASKNVDDKEFQVKVASSVRAENKYRSEIENVEKAKSKIDTDKVLNKIDSKQYKMIMDNLDKEYSKLQKLLDNASKEKQLLLNKERWVDWVSKFKKTYLDVDGLKEEEKKEYLEGILDKILVSYDNKLNEHKVQLKFLFPIVNDKYIIDKKEDKKSNKKREYRVIEGKKVLEFTDNFNKRRNVSDSALPKKKPFAYRQI